MARGMLDLADDGRGAAPTREDGAAGLDVAGTPHEADRDVVDVDLGAEREVGDIFVGEGVGGDGGVGKIDALVLAQGATVEHLGTHQGVGDFDCAQDDGAVGDEDAVADLEIVGEAWVGDVDGGGRGGR